MLATRERLQPSRLNLAEFLRERLAEGLRPEERTVADVPALIEWARQHRFLHGRPFSLARFRPLEALYRTLPEHKETVIMKAAQVGASEACITLTCWALDVGHLYWDVPKEGLNVAYLFPTQKSLADFSKERFTSLRQESQYLHDLFTGGFDDIGFKQARKSNLYLRGAWTVTALMSFPADVLILDEYDQMDSHAVALAEKRLRASHVKYRLRLSTPTLPGKGVHAAYLGSDQRKWFTPCPACGESVVLDFFRDVRANGEDWEAFKLWEDEERYREADWSVVCPNCGEPIPDEVRFNEGEWRATRPEIKSVRGYHLPALCFPSFNFATVAADLTSGDPSRVAEAYRSDLGLPFAAEGAAITDAMLSRLSVELPGAELPAGVTFRTVTMGVDVGSRFNYRISGSAPGDARRYVLKMGIARSWDELDTLMQQYRVTRCVVDAMPEIHGAQNWANKWRGRVLRAFYPNSSYMAGQLFQPEPEKIGRRNESGEIDDVIRINRTMAMDAVYANVAGAKEYWPASIHNDPAVAEQMKAPVRVIAERDDGQEIATWEHTSPDHYFHACVYDLIAYRSLPVIVDALVQAGVKGWNPK